MIAHKRETPRASKTWRRSVSVSVASTTLDFGIFALASFFVIGPALVLARWLAGAVGAVANFTLNRRWAFASGRPGERRTRSPLGAEAGRYTLLALGSITLATSIWWFLSRLTPLNPRVLHPISMALVWILFSYPLLRRWVFRDADETDGDLADGVPGDR